MGEPPEQDPTGSSFNRESSWRQRLGRFVGGVIGGSAAGAAPMASASQQSNITTFDQALGNLVKTGGSIAALDNALAGLATKMAEISVGTATSVSTTGANPHGGFANVMPASGTTGPGVAGSGAFNVTPTPAKPTNPHSGLRLAEAGGAFAIGGMVAAGRLYGGQAEKAIELTPYISQLQLRGGMTYGQTAGALSNRTLTYGTQGPMDTMAMAQAAQSFTGMGFAPGTQGGRANADIMQNFSAMMMAMPGVSGAQAAQTYSQLRQPQQQWQQYRLGFPSFTGPGATAPDITKTASDMVQRVMQMTARPGETPAMLRDPNWMGQAFGAEKYGPRQQLLTRLTGSTESAQMVSTLAIAQERFTQNGGKGVLFSGIDPNNKQDYKKFESDARRAGLGGEQIEKLRLQMSQDSNKTLAFAQSQEQNIAQLVEINTRVEGILRDIAQGLGGPGMLASLGSQAVGQLGNPLGLYGAYKLLGGREGVKGMAGSVRGLFGGGAPTAAAGAAGAGGAGLGATALAGGLTAGISGITGWGASKLIKSQIEGTGGEWAGAAGGAAAGAGVGAALGLATGPFAPIGVPAGAILGGIAGGLGGWIGDPDDRIGGGIGDPASDILQARNSSSAGPSAVTGLQPGFARVLARMFTDNPALRLNSGYRDIAHQERLWADALKKYGSAEAARKWVAPPGHSPHQRGIAADIGPDSQYGWLRSNAGRYGLVNYTAEPWHWEPAGASGAGNRSNYGVNPDPTLSEGLGGVTSTTGGSATAAGAAPTGGTGAPVSSAVATQDTYAGPSLHVGSAVGSGFGTSTGELHKMLLGEATVAGARTSSGQWLSLQSAAGGAAAGAAGATGAAVEGGGAPGGELVKGTGTAGSRGAFAMAVLKGLGAPTTRENISAMLAWMQGEHAAGKGGGAAFNPLNTTLNREGATNFNSVGVKNFTSWEQGVEATIFAMSGGKNQARYAHIVAALKQGNNPQGALSALAASPWGTGALAEKIYPDLAKKYDQYFAAGVGSGVGDPATYGVDGGRGGSRGGSTALMMSNAPTTINATFNISAAGQNAEQLAHQIWSKIKDLEAQEHRRSA